MDEKLFNCLSRGLMVLYEGFCEEHGVRMVNPRLVLVDDQEDKPAEEAAT